MHLAQPPAAKLSYNHSASRWHTLGMSSQSLGPPSAPECLEYHTCLILKASTMVRRPGRGSSFPGNGSWVLPKLRFPWNNCPYPFRTRTLTCAEWGPCAASGSGNTAWSTPWHGTCRAGLQKQDTHSYSPSAYCFCLLLLAFTDQPPPLFPTVQSFSPLPSPFLTTRLEDWDAPRGLHLPF